MDNNKVPLRVSDEDGDFYTAGIILCPVCGEGCMHHLGITYYIRGEDDKYGTVMTLTEPFFSITIGNDIKNNPSGRRGGMTIYFGCEICGEAYGLDIIQHKGTEYTEWNKIDENNYKWPPYDKPDECEEDETGVK